MCRARVCVCDVSEYVFMCVSVRERQRDDKVGWRRKGRKEGEEREEGVRWEESRRLCVRARACTLGEPTSDGGLIRGSSSLYRVFSLARPLSILSSL